MSEAPRPDDLREQRTPVAPEPPEEGRSAADPGSEPGLGRAFARFPYWFVVIGVVLVAVIALTIVWFFFPPR
jgi:hypothetical protein